MKELLAPILSNPQPPPQDGGLPYWIFWFLISIIFLLFMFIFLREKELRKRINSFFFGVKFYLKKSHLKLKQNRELHKKTKLLRQIGQTAWENGIKGEKNQGTTAAELINLEKKNKLYQHQLNKINLKLESLKKRLKGSQKIFHSLHKQKQTLNKKNNNLYPPEQKQENKIEELINQEKRRIKDIRKDIKNSKKQKKKIKKNIKSVAQKKDKLFLKLGQQIDENRVNHHLLSFYYVQVDERNQRLQTIERQIGNIK